MTKAILVTLSVDIPETEQGKDATVTVGTTPYTGRIDAIIVYTPQTPPTATKITLEGLGLKTA